MEETELGGKNNPNEANTALMEVDSPSSNGTQNKSESQSEDKGAAQLCDSNGKAEVDDIFVVEEDDGGEDDEERVSENFKTPEPMDATCVSATDKDITGENADARPKKDEVVMVKNPVFGRKDVPVIDIESSSGSSDDESDEEEDFSEDVNVNNFHQTNNSAVEGEIILNGAEDDIGKAKEQREIGEGCNSDCYHEKGILINEIERLRKAVFELNERHSVIEDFIEVEYGDRFEKFLKNREHLVSMGFGAGNSYGSEDIIDGKRSAKSAELIELLKMIKEQANAKEETDGTKKSPSSSKGGNQPSKNQPKSKSVPSVASQRDRDSGRGGALSYNQRPVLAPSTVSGAYAMNFQYQQQVLAQESQLRQYYESMYGNSGRGDYITAVGRTALYPSPSVPRAGYGYERRSDGGGSSKESKKQRKRKRQSEQSSEAGSAANAAAGSSKNIPNSAKGTTKPAVGDDDDEVEIIDYSQSLNPNAKRICPLCEKILNRKGLRDHLAIVHQGHKVACPVCQAEFMHRKKIKTHMRDAHDLPVSEYTAYIEKIYSNIEEQCGPWLDKLMKEAETPTKDQLLVHNAEVQLTMLSKREEKTAETGVKPSTTRPVVTNNTSSSKPSGSAQSRSSAPASSSRAAKPSSSSSGARRDNRDKNRDHNRRGGSSSYFPSQSQPVRYFTGANSKVSSKGYGAGSRDTSSNELYGPGGYAQYAARYLQQRAVSGSGNGVPVSRIYTPF